MVRSAPSRAVRDAVAALRSRGVDVTDRQVESWQAGGLLPKGQQRWAGGGGSTVELPEDFSTRVEIIARLAPSRRTPDDVALALYARDVPLDARSLGEIRTALVRMLSDARTYVAACAPDSGGSGSDVYDAGDALAESIVTKRRRAPMVQAWARNIKPWIADDEDRELAARPVNEVLAGLIGPVLAAMAGGTEMLDASTPGLAAAVGLDGIDGSPSRNVDAADAATQSMRVIFERGRDVAEVATAQELDAARAAIAALVSAGHAGVTTSNGRPPTPLGDGHVHHAVVAIALVTLERAGLVDIASFTALAREAACWSSDAEDQMP